MQYIALLRGINVGGNKKVDMKRLKTMLESMGYTNVSTYLNSGNVFFESKMKEDEIQEKLAKALIHEFGFEISVLVKSQEEIARIVDVVPQEWQNNKEQKTDVAFLFPAIDSEELIDEIPVKREYVELLYTQGAIIWHVMKSDYNKSQLNKLVGRKIYQQMTVRNINTARYLAKGVEKI